MERVKLTRDGVLQELGDLGKKMAKWADQVAWEEGRDSLRVAREQDRVAALRKAYRAVLSVPTCHFRCRSTVDASLAEAIEFISGIEGNRVSLIRRAFLWGFGSDEGWTVSGDRIVYMGKNSA